MNEDERAQWPVQLPKGMSRSCMNDAIDEINRWADSDDLPSQLAANLWVLFERLREETVSQISHVR